MKYLKILLGKKTYLGFFFLISIFLSVPVHAYAGPGVAIGAIIVFITVILTFFASTIITIFNFFKNKIIKSKKNKPKKEKSK